MICIQVKGNIQSVRESTLKELEALYELRVSRDELVPQELSERLARLSCQLNREIALYINRRGMVVDVSVGDSGTVSLGSVDGRKDSGRLSGIRCIHTHPGGRGLLSAVDVSSLLSLRLDAMVALGIEDGSVREIFAGLPVRDRDGKFTKAEIYGPFSPGETKINGLMHFIRDMDKSQPETLHVNDKGEERAILVGLETNEGSLLNGKSEGERLLDELEELAATAGARVLKKVLQKRKDKDPAYFIGKGKVEELSLIRQAMDANLIIFDDELTGAQVRNIENLTGVKVIDRTTLILDIFAQRARTREGKLQVELAQLNYRLPRLVGMGTQLSRLGGGIGTRGPGEKKLEVDRRHIRRRISALEAELKALNKRRGHLREARKKNAIPTLALVGYTNVGKSTLMNRFCGSDVFAENKLFATLDPTTRKMTLPDGREVLLVDTVGFIRKLPHELVEAFKSTLQEAVHADALLHVADASSEEVEVQIGVASDLLQALDALNKPVLLVLNKVDMVHRDIRLSGERRWEKALEVSAVTGKGMDALTQAIMEIFPPDETELEVLIPYGEEGIIAFLHEKGKVLEKNFMETGTMMKVRLNSQYADKIKNYIR